MVNGTVPRYSAEASQKIVGELNANDRIRSRCWLPISVVALASDTPNNENSSTSFIPYVKVTSFDADDKRRKRYGEYSVAPIICDRHGIPKPSLQFKFAGFNAVITIEALKPVSWPLNS